MREASCPLSDSRIDVAGDSHEGLSMPDREKACQWLQTGRGRLLVGIFSPKEHGMGCQDADLHRRADLINAGGALAAVDNLAGRKTDRVQVFRSMELPR